MVLHRGLPEVDYFEVATKLSLGKRKGKKKPLSQYAIAYNIIVLSSGGVISAHVPDNKLL